jgi:DNA-binding transcriptional LysR family regulator
LIPFNLTHLEALSAIAEQGSFRAAAERLGVTQPTVSMRVRDLEAALGVRLFDRSGHRAILSEQGRETLRYAQRMIALARELHATAASVDLAGLVRVGAADTFALTHLPVLLGELERRYPRLRVDLTIDHSVRLDRLLRRDGIDLAFLTMPGEVSDLHLERLFPVELRWMASPGLMPARGELSARQLATVPILTNPAPSHLYSSVRNWFAASGETPERLHTCNSLTVMIKLAAAGVGASLLPTAIIGGEIASGTLRELRTRQPVPPHMFYLARRREAGSPQLRFVEDVAREILAGVAV